MERELVGLLGAGLASVATGFGVAVPVGAIDSGYTLVDVISRESGPRLGAALNGMVQTLWLDWQKTGLDRETLAMHAGALPAIIELNRPPPDAFAAARSGNDSARMLAALLVEHARHSGDMARAALDEGIAFIMLEGLYRAILSEAAVLPEMVAAVDLYMRTDLWRRDVPAAPPAAPEPAPPPPAAPPPAASAPTPTPPPTPKLVPRLAAPAIEAIRAAVEAAGAAVADPEATVAKQCQTLTSLIERVADLAQRAPWIAERLVEAARMMAAGDFQGADHALSAAEQVVMHNAATSLSSARQMMHLAAEILASRAALEEARFEFRKAARQYRTATRCLTNADVPSIWKFLMLQAQALLSHDELKRDDAAFAEAAAVLGQACALDRRHLSTEAWADGLMQSIRINLELGHRRGRVDDFLAAANQSAAALAAYTEIQSAHGIAEASSALARALWLAGDHTGDLATLEHAAGALRHALDAVPREADPARWVEISSKLGQAILRIATIRGEPRMLPAAIEHLRGAVQFANTCNVPIDGLAADTALGRALLGEYAAGGAPLLLDLAATAFRRAIKSATASRDIETSAGLRHELGMTLWAMADRAADAIAHAGAIEALESSIGGFESIGAADRAAAVRADLTRMLETRVIESDNAPPAKAIQQM